MCAEHPDPRGAGWPQGVCQDTTLAQVDARVTGCFACPRLVAWREEVARVRRAAFADQTYWARPVPSFGDERARILVVGLAPSAHGGNRTGRMFKIGRASCRERVSRRV